MFDTLAVARRLADGGVGRDQAEVIAGAIGQAVDQGDHVTSDQFEAGLAAVRAEIAGLDTRLSTQMADLRAEQRTEIAGVRTEIANIDKRLSTQVAGLDTRLSTQLGEARTEIADLETRLIRWMVGTVIATATLTVAILRLLG